MPINISDDLIHRSEEILLKGGAHFDEERIAFIREMETCDLLAVPGSGKTTALQAKLYCLCQSMHAQLKAGKGILVLSHTNVAVEEIRKLLCLH